MPVHDCLNDTYFMYSINRWLFPLFSVFVLIYLIFNSTRLWSQIRNLKNGASGQDGVSQQINDLRDSTTLQHANQIQVCHRSSKDSCLLIDSNDCNFPEENDDFVGVFTSQTVSSDCYQLNDHYPMQNNNCATLVCSQVSTFHDNVLSETEID